MRHIPRVVVVGGGIAGLASALRLRHLAPDAEVTLIERDRRLGGKIMTTRSLGYVIEGGPDSFLASKPEALRLCQELRIDEQLQGPRDDRRGAFVMRSGELVPIPQGLSGLVPARLEPLLASDLLTEDGKARVMREPEIPPRLGDEDESLASFVERRFGRELYDKLLEALMTGIYAGSGENLSLLATFPHLRTLEKDHGSVLRALAQHQPSSESTSAHRSGFLAPIRGMQQIVETMARHLHGTRIVRRRAVNHLMKSNGGWSVRLTGGGSIDADAVIVATPSSTTAHLLVSLDDELARAFARVPLVSTATVALGFREEHTPHSLVGSGYLIPRAEGRPVTACTWVSSKWAHRAPPGRVLLRVFLGRAGMEEPAMGPSEEMVRLARTELRETLGITAEPELVSVSRWPDAMPQYTLGHAERMTHMRKRLSNIPGLAVAGNAIAGVGIPDCIRSGWDAADVVLNALYPNLPDGA